MSQWQKTDLGYERDDLLVGPPPNEDALAYSYLMLKQSVEIDKVFHQSPMPLREYLAWMAEPNIVMIGAWRKIPQSELRELVGFSFFNRAFDIPGLRKAEVGFAFWDTPISAYRIPAFTKVQIIRRFMDYLFSQSETDAIFGLTPERNAGAVALIKRAGMRMYGPIPSYCGWHGEACGAWISQMDRKTWLNSPYTIGYDSR